MKDQKEQVLEILKAEGVVNIATLMQYIQPSEYAVLPLQVIEKVGLSASCKVLYAGIHLFTRAGKCFATNGALVKYTGLAEKTVSTGIQTLTDNGLITVEYKGNGRIITSGNGSKKRKAKSNPEREKRSNEIMELFIKEVYGTPKDKQTLYAQNKKASYRLLKYSDKDIKKSIEFIKKQSYLTTYTLSTVCRYIEEAIKTKGEIKCRICGKENLTSYRQSGGIVCDDCWDKR